MPISDQGITGDRYALIPRTAIFVRRGNAYLLLKGAPDKRLWAGKYNCLGGHVELGEDILAAARRELSEETGLHVELWLVGTVIVDTDQNPGVCLFLFCGEWSGGEPVPSHEGQAEWIPIDALGKLPVVEDLPILLGRIHQMQSGDNPFAARSYYDERGALVVKFSDEN